MFGFRRSRNLALVPAADEPSGGRNHDLDSAVAAESLAGWRYCYVDRDPRQRRSRMHSGTVSALAESAPHFGCGKTLAPRILSSGPTPTTPERSKSKLLRAIVSAAVVSIATARYTLLSNTNADRPVIIPTSHPLVLLYSAPPCEAGSRMKVRFQSTDGFTQDTPYKPCAGGLSINFYLAGLRAADRILHLSHHRHRRLIRGGHRPHPHDRDEYRRTCRLPPC